MISKINSIKDTVHDLLRKFPDTRDNDRLLLIYVWAIQTPELKESSYSFKQFGFDFIDGKYADPESVRRTRQKIQEVEPKLRGSSYKDRIGVLQDEMTSGITQLKFPEPKEDER